MRTYNHLYDNGAYFSNFLQEIEWEESDEILIRIHSAIHTKTEMETLLAEIRQQIPSAHLIGCSAMQIIHEGRLVSGACLISVSVFERAEIHTGHLSCRDAEGRWKTGSQVGRELVAKIHSGKKGFLFIFFPLAYSKIEEFVDTVNGAGLPVKMLGGASYKEDEEGTVREDLAFVLEGETVSAYDMSFAYITEPGLSVYGDYVCGVEAVGRQSCIVSNGCVIEEIDNMSGAEWYSGLLGKEDLQQNPALAHVFPIIKRDERGIAYYVDYVRKENHEQGYQLRTFAELKSGSRVSLGYFHPQKIFNQVREVMQNVEEHPSESLFAYDCQSRLIMLHNCASWEIANFNTTNISGALLNGEISSRNGENLYANYTFALASISENEESHFRLNDLDVRSVQDLQENNVQMLNYLLVNANKHLSEEIQEQQLKMQNAVFYNAAVGVDNQLRYQFDREREGLDKAAIFSLNNEKMLRLFSGVTETYGFLRSCYEKAQQKYGVSGLHMYSYNDTSLLIAADEQVSKETFHAIVDGMHEYLNQCVYDDICLSYTTVIVLGEEDSIHRLETALHYARNHRLAKIRFDEIGDDLKKEQEDIHMLWVIREALLHRRVVPYFQEIHNNKGDKKRMFESLMRISDGDGKIYFPDQFLPVAKEYDLYESLSELMVKTVIEMFQEKDIRVTINLNVQDIYDRNMIQMIFDHMKQVRHPENFVFEIVESEEITDYEYIKGFADRIHEIGGRIAIDDFGSGFSNMLHLFKLEADYIKIDGAIVRTITEDSLCRDFITFMNGWCRKAGQELICEYIENEEIQNIMEEIGVAHSQGYYFSKPHQWGPEDE